MLLVQKAYMQTIYPFFISVPASLLDFIPDDVELVSISILFELFGTMHVGSMV